MAFKLHVHAQRHSPYPSGERKERQPSPCEMFSVVMHGRRRGDSWASTRISSASLIMQQLGQGLHPSTGTVSVPHPRTEGFPDTAIAWNVSDGGSLEQLPCCRHFGTRCRLFGFQVQRRQRRQSQTQRVRPSVRGLVLRLNSAHVAHAAATVFRGVAVQQFPPEPAGWELPTGIQPAEPE